MKYAPVFLKDDKRFLIRHSDWLADTERKAWEIGLGSFVEAVIYNFKFTGDVISIEGKKATEAQLGSMEVFILEQDKTR